MNFRRSVIIAGLWRLKSQDVKIFRNFAFFWKNNPLRWIFQNCVPKVFIATPIDVLCSNFVKFGWREIGEIVRCLHDKKIAWLGRCRYCADRSQNMPGPAPDNVLRVLQISSKSVHSRRSYSRMREHRQNAPQSELIFGRSLASSRITKSKRN